MLERLRKIAVPLALVAAAGVFFWIQSAGDGGDGANPPDAKQGAGAGDGSGASKGPERLPRGEQREKRLASLKAREKSLEERLKAELEAAYQADPALEALRKESAAQANFLRSQEMVVKGNYFQAWARRHQKDAVNARNLALLRAYREALADPAIAASVQEGFALQTSFQTEDRSLLNNASAEVELSQRGWKEGMTDAGEPGMLPVDILARLQQGPEATFDWAESNFSASYGKVPEDSARYLAAWAASAVRKTTASLGAKDALPPGVRQLQEDIHQVRTAIWDLTKADRETTSLK